ncbi:MAG: rRNA pseudouridine synthase [Lachnospiraceae bacterium]|nr:rRNA pseudouridine synthase [Lachnospiraceae bacterium]
MRLDKFLCDNHIGSRSEVKTLIKKGLITVNNQVAKDPGMNIDGSKDSVFYKGAPVQSEAIDSCVYALYKPTGYVCSKEEKDGIPVFELLPENIRESFSSIGRLDKDTTGLLLFTNDGELLHLLISPRRHVDKTYIVSCEKEITEEDCVKLSDGVNLGDGEVSLPAKCELNQANSKVISITIHEGKYHQIKRMMKATCNKVTALHRISFGNLSIESLSLKEKEGRFLNESEIELLKSSPERKV